jgi:hypothetical protein
MIKGMCYVVMLDGQRIYFESVLRERGMFLFKIPNENGYENEDAPYYAIGVKAPGGGP